MTLANDITVNPVPAVTGTYYVPTFTSNAEVTINGTGFETEITASSAHSGLHRPGRRFNPNYRYVARDH